jgi:hypothetical protein
LYGGLLKLLQKIGMFKYRMAARFPFFNKRQLNPAGTFHAGALIWRILFAEGNLIVGESRNQETKTTSYFCLDLHSGRPVWQNIGFDEPWWIGIEAVYDKWLILHGYVRPDMPEHRGIRVVAIESGKLLWRNDTLSFWFVENEILYAHKYIFEKHIGCELDIRTGSMLKEHTDDLGEMRQLRQKVFQKEAERQQDVIFPQVYNEQEAYTELRTSVRRLTKGKALEGWIEYLIHRELLILSQYQEVPSQPGSPLLENILTVFDLNGNKILYNESIAQGVQAPSPDSFFVKDNILLFITQQTSLTSLMPWKS